MVRENEISRQLSLRLASFAAHAHRNIEDFNF